MRTKRNIKHEVHRDRTGKRAGRATSPCLPSQLLVKVGLTSLDVEVKISNVLACFVKHIENESEHSHRGRINEIASFHRVMADAATTKTYAKGVIPVKRFSSTQSHSCRACIPIPGSILRTHVLTSNSAPLLTCLTPGFSDFIDKCLANRKTDFYNI